MHNPHSQYKLKPSTEITGHSLLGESVSFLGIDNGVKSGIIVNAEIGGEGPTIFTVYSLRRNKFYHVPAAECIIN
jgi:hypothetical protein